MLAVLADNKQESIYLCAASVWIREMLKIYLFSRKTHLIEFSLQSFETYVASTGCASFNLCATLPRMEITNFWKR